MVLEWIYKGNIYGETKWSDVYRPSGRMYNRSRYDTNRGHFEAWTGWDFPIHPVLRHNNSHCKKDFPMGRLFYDMPLIAGQEPKTRNVIIGYDRFELLPGTYEWRSVTDKGAPEDPTYPEGWSETCTIVAEGETHYLHSGDTLRVKLQEDEESLNPEL